MRLEIKASREFSEEVLTVFYLYLDVKSCRGKQKRTMVLHHIFYTQARKKEERLRSCLQPRCVGWKIGAQIKLRSVMGCEPAEFTRSSLWLWDSAAHTSSGSSVMRSSMKKLRCCKKSHRRFLAFCLLRSIFEWNEWRRSVGMWEGQTPTPEDEGCSHELRVPRTSQD